MTTINSYAGSSYYQLSGSSAQSRQTTAFQSSAQQLLSATQTNDDTGLGAYLLDLSPEAQQYLSGQQSTTTSSYLSGKESFTLSSQQQKKISDILADYKDAPYNQTTFNKIQDDLKDASLDTATLKRIDQLNSFNSTEVLVAYLSGRNVPSSSIVDPSKQQAKADNYIQGILQQWQNLSSTYGTESSDTSSDAVQAAGGASDA